MVLSLAFILAFIGAAVALLVGILIFSEVTDAMAQTLPTPMETASVDPTWGLREHDISAVQTVGIDFVQSGNELLIDSDPASSFGHGYIMKTFDKADIIDRQLEVKWRGTFGGALTSSHIEVRDGSYTPSSVTDFVPSTTTIASKGGGICHSVSVTHPFANADKIQMDLSCSTLNQVTVLIWLEDDQAFIFGRTNMEYVEISGVKRWNFDSGSTLTWTDSGQNDDGSIDTSTQNPVNATQPSAFMLTPAEQQQVDTFNNALNIGFTVLGIVPVALFFALFAIFGSLGGGRVSS